MMDISWNLRSGQRYRILTPKNKSMESHYFWLLRVEKYLEQYNLDDILYIDSSELLPKHVFKKKVRLFF